MRISDWSSDVCSSDLALSQPLRTKGGEPTVTRLASAGLQLRRAEPGRMTRAAEQTFLRALSDSANIRLAAAAAFAHSSFYAKARADPVFAKEMQRRFGSATTARMRLSRACRL